MNQTLEFLSTTVGFIIRMLVCALACVSEFIVNAWEPTKAYLIYAYHQITIMGTSLMVFIKSHMAVVAS